MELQAIAGIAQVMGPAVAVYAAIRADIAGMRVRLDHIERDIYPDHNHHQQRRHYEQEKAPQNPKQRQ